MAAALLDSRGRGKVHVRSAGSLFQMRILLAALATGFILLAAACSPGQAGPSEFRQPLAEPPVHKAANAPDPSRLLSGVLSSVQTAQFRIVGTEMAPGPQGQ